jgi:RNA recognition motif-containing protein
LRFFYCALGLGHPKIKKEKILVSKGGRKMGKNIYIGNLAEAVTEEDLKANLAQAGKVISVNVIKDKYTGLSRGFGFVEMGTEEEAKEAIRRFDNGDLLGKTIKVNEAQAKKDSRLGGPGTDSRGRAPKLGRGWRY